MVLWTTYKNLPSAKNLPKMTHPKFLQTRLREVQISFLQGQSCSGAPAILAGCSAVPYCPLHPCSKPCPPPSAVSWATCKHHTAGNIIQKNLTPHVPGYFIELLLSACCLCYKVPCMQFPPRALHGALSICVTTELSSKTLPRLPTALNFNPRCI